MIVLPTHMSVCYVPGPCGGQKRASDPLEEELQVAVVNHCVGAGNQCRSSVRTGSTARLPLTVFLNTRFI